MSALPPIADMCSALVHFRFVPIADMERSVSGPSGYKLAMTPRILLTSWCIRNLI